MKKTAVILAGILLGISAFSANAKVYKSYELQCFIKTNIPQPEEGRSAFCKARIKVFEEGVDYLIGHTSCFKRTRGYLLNKLNFALKGGFIPIERECVYNSENRQECMMNLQTLISVYKSLSATK